MHYGVVGRNGEPLRQADITAMMLADVSAAKLDTLGKHDGLFVVFQPPSGDGYAPAVQEAYEKGIRWFLIHRHPNSMEHGLGTYWRNGKEFAEWWIDVWGALTQHFPEAKWGMPAMKPGEKIGTFQEDAEAFFAEAQSAVTAADFIEVECQWKTERERKIELWRLDSYMLRNTDKQFIVEFCNMNSNMSKEDKGFEYIKFYKALEERGVHAAFSYCVSSAHQLTSRCVCWCGEKAGLPTAIPKILGDRLG